MRDVEPEGHAAATFIVRLMRDDTGTVRGVVERARTGAKERFEGYEALGAVIARMLDGESVLRVEPA